MNILKRKCYYCGKDICECTDEAPIGEERKNVEQQDLDLDDMRTDKEGVLVAGALSALGGNRESKRPSLGNVRKQ